MPSISPVGKVEFLTRLSGATSVIEAAIRSSILHGTKVKVRDGGSSLIGPEDAGYDTALNKFKVNVSGEHARTILGFLYGFDKTLSQDVEAFKNSYKEYFQCDPGKWDTVLYYFPKLDQTTLAIILTPISSTTLGYRLEDLHLAGLIERNNHKPPTPKHVRITRKGVQVLDSAIEEAMAWLSPVFSYTALSLRGCPQRPDERTSPVS